jgi:hypothetical protein
MNSQDATKDWDARLGQAKGLIVTLTRDTRGLRLDDRARPVGGACDLAAGTRVQYVETRHYDWHRLEEVAHKVKVMSGPSTGTWVGLLDTVGLEQLPWEG